MSQIEITDLTQSLPDIRIPHQRTARVRDFAGRGYCYLAVGTLEDNSFIKQVRKECAEMLEALEALSQRM